MIRLVAWHSNWAINTNRGKGKSDRKVQILSLYCCQILQLEERTSSPSGRTGVCTSAVDGGFPAVGLLGDSQTMRVADGTVNNRAENGQACHGQKLQALCTSSLTSPCDLHRTQLIHLCIHEAESFSLLNLYTAKEKVKNCYTNLHTFNCCSPLSILKMVDKIFNIYDNASVCKKLYLACAKLFKIMKKVWSSLMLKCPFTNICH